MCLFHFECCAQCSRVYTLCKRENAGIEKQLRQNSFKMNWSLQSLDFMLNYVYCNYMQLIRLAVVKLSGHSHTLKEMLWLWTWTLLTLSKSCSVLQLVQNSDSREFFSICRWSLQLTEKINGNGYSLNMVHVMCTALVGLKT